MINEDHKTHELITFIKENGIEERDHLNYKILQIKRIRFKFCWFSPPNKSYEGRFGWTIMSIRSIHDDVLPLEHVLSQIENTDLHKPIVNYYNGVWE